MSSTMVAKLIHGSQEQFSSPLEALSDRELEVFRMLGHGKAVRLIAEEMGVTVPTVNSFRNRIKEKLNLKSSTEVMLQAIQWVQDQKPL
jgi:DNA-binding NarL/FixJ family response regulator